MQPEHHMPGEGQDGGAQAYAPGDEEVDSAEAQGEAKGQP